MMTVPWDGESDAAATAPAFYDTLKGLEMTVL